MMTTLSTTDSKLTVLGAGSWGTALAIHLAKQHPHVTLWGRDALQVKQVNAARCNTRYLPSIQLPANLTVTDDFAAAISDSHLLLIVVPSHAFEACLQQIKPFYKPDMIITWATKGITANGEFLHQVVERILGKQTRKAVVAGPSFAIEVASELPTAITVASDQEQSAREVAQLLSGKRFRVYTCQDMIGAQLGGAVKNVLAIATGSSDGLGFGANARSALITRGLAELMRLGAAMHAQTETLMGLAGLGDLILTCTDDKSRNRRFGLALGRGSSAQDAIENIGQVVEGVTAAAHVYHLAQKHHVEMPITEQVYRVLQGEHSAADAVKILLSRAPATE
ncbi:MAG: NAD(P)H-dependent glycerol-3-phosphate dehydrogenase [Gammaproteobacteria bacterium]